MCNDRTWWIGLWVWVFSLSVMFGGEVASKPELYGKFYELRGRIQELSLQGDIWRYENLRREIAFTSPWASGKIAVDARLWVVLAMLYLNQVDRLTEGYNPNDLPYLNLEPPGGKYMSGISPDSIREPEIREAYLKALEANKIKIDYTDRCGALRREKSFLLDRLNRYLRMLSEPEFKDQIEPLVASVCSTPEEFQRRLKELRPQPAEKP